MVTVGLGRLSAKVLVKLKSAAEKCKDSCATRYDHEPWYDRVEIPELVTSKAYR
jgi:hypothetical protein